MTLDEAIACIPDGWFLHDLGECVTPINFRGDRHEPTGLFQAGIQHRGGDRMTRANGNNLSDAVKKAVDSIRDVFIPPATAAIEDARHTEMQHCLMKLRNMVDSQAEDAGLWFIAQFASEAYLQQELRKLHVLIEALAAHSPSNHAA